MLHIMWTLLTCLDLQSDINRHEILSSITRCEAHIYQRVHKEYHDDIKVNKMGVYKYYCVGLVFFLFIDLAYVAQIGSFKDVTPPETVSEKKKKSSQTHWWAVSE